MKLTADGCRARQQTLAAELDRLGLATAVIGQREHILYFSGYWHPRLQAAAVSIDRRGRTTLVAAAEADPVAVDELIPYVPRRMATLHNRQPAAVADALRPLLPDTGRLGFDYGAPAALLPARDAVDLTDGLLRLRKRKYPDELAALRSAIDLTAAMYRAVREQIAPGMDELDLFARLHAVAILAAGGDLDAFGNDFQANAGGGPPRRRPMAAGELYILDAGPVLDGYFADNCRTFAVDGCPTPAQQRAWQTLDALFPHLEAHIRPGVPAVDLYRLADRWLREHGYEGMVHHLGHGVGLSPHEAPQLNPQFNAVLEEHDVFTMEPGVYAPELRAGIRIEENYLVTANGFEKLTAFHRALC